MKKLLLILSIALAACGPYVPSAPVADPCDQSVFDEVLCQTAITNHGYYYQGAFVPMVYSHPYGYYNHTHIVYVDHGGRWTRPNATVYSRTYVVPRSTVTTTRVITPSPIRSGTIRGTSMSRTYSRPPSPRTFSSGRRR